MGIWLADCIFREMIWDQVIFAGADRKKTDEDTMMLIPRLKILINGIKPLNDEECRKENPSVEFNPP